VSNRYLNSSCDKAFNGWPCDPEMETLRDRFARETDPGPAEGDRRGRTGPRHRMDALHSSRRMASGFRRPPQRHGIYLGRPHCVLERREEVNG